MVLRLVWGRAPLQWGAAFSFRLRPKAASGTGSAPESPLLSSSHDSGRNVLTSFRFPRRPRTANGRPGDGHRTGAAASAHTFHPTLPDRAESPPRTRVTWAIISVSV